MQITSDFSWETMQARRKESEIFTVLRGKTNKHWSRILYPAKLFFKSGGENDFLSTQKLRDFVVNRPAIHKMSYTTTK